MPPKKKKSAKKKKSKGDGELTVEDKYKKTLEEIEALKDQLTIRKELARRGQSNSDDWKVQMREAKESLEEQTDEHKAVTADMTRQYKTMQTEMGVNIHQLEAELARTRARLDETESQLQKTREERDRLCRDKDQEIADLTVAIDTMGLQYENVLNDAMDRLMMRLGQAKEQWDDKSTFVQEKNKRTLLEFGLNPLDL